MTTNGIECTPPKSLPHVLWHVSCFYNITITMDVHLVMNNSDGQPFLFKNKATENGNHFLRVQLKVSNACSSLNAKVYLKDLDGKILQV